VIRALRRTRLASLLSTATLLCVISLSGASFFHSENDDPICDPVLVVHDHTAHRLVAGHGAPTAPAHCFICHWQSLRTVHAVVHEHAPATESHAVVALAWFGFDPAALSRQPARAPPLA
jgi:hypothetical protein